MSNNNEDSRYWRVWQFVSLGSSCQELLCCRRDAPLGAVATMLRSVIAQLDTLELRGCYLWASEELARLASRLEHRSAIGQTDLGDDVSRLHLTIDELQVRVQEESREALTYPVRPIRPYNARQLIHDPYSLLPIEQPVYNLLPNLAPAVLEASRCFAVGFYWAAAYFITMAAEIVYKKYWDLIVEEPHDPRSTWGWLNTQLIAKIGKSLVTDLSSDIIKEYRNPMMHGELVDIAADQAIMLLNECRELVCEISADSTRWQFPVVTPVELPLIVSGDPSKDSSTGL